MFKIFTIDSSDTETVIPLAYNAFLYSYYRKNKIDNYQNEVLLSDELVDILKEYLDYAYNETTEKTIIIDFQNIASCNRAFKEYSSEKFLSFLVFANVPKDSIVENRIEEGIKGFKKDVVGNCSYFAANSHKNELAINLDFNSIYENYIVEILRKNKVISEDENKSNFLDSSGIYSTSYIHIKKIFYSFHDYLYIIYKLAEKIVNMNLDKIDALISTSKTGGIIATLVGNLLGIKVVHCLGLGPKNMLPIETINEKLRKNRNYFLVSDFICIGTEIKIINTIMMCSKSNLIGGISVASYIDLTDPKYSNSIVGKMSTLINIVKHGVNYNISGYEYKGEKNDE